MKPVRFQFKLKYLAILALAALLLGNRGFHSLLRNYREYSRLKSEKTQLELQRRDLERKLVEVSKKPAIEQAARAGLGLIKPDETEYRFPAPQESDK